MAVSKVLQKRRDRLMPNGIPKYVRCYDSGPDEVADRYTVVFTGNFSKDSGAGSYPYLSMSENPTHPHGVIGRHNNDAEGKAIDRFWNEWPRKIGHKHPTLGTRIEWDTLPQHCRYLALNEYREIWRI